MRRSYSSHIQKLSKKAFLKWYPFGDGLGESEYETLHADDNPGILQKDKVSKSKSVKSPGSGKK